MTSINAALDYLGGFYSTSEKIKRVIKWQLKELENTEQYPIYQAFLYSQLCDEYHCVMDEYAYDEKLVRHAFQMIILNSAYYQAAVGRCIDDITIKLVMIDPQTCEVYKTIIHS